MIRLGIVGTGGMAEYQAKKFSELPGCMLTACKDHKADHAAAFCGRFGIANRFHSIEEMLNSGLCDALSCAVIDSRHRAICDAALSRSMPLLCEKPLARSVADCAALAAAAAAAGSPAMVNFSKRNAPALWALAAAAGSGRLGEIAGVEASYRQGWAATKAWGDWRAVPRWKWRLSPASSTAGILGDLGTHLADALLLLFGSILSDGKAEVLSLSEAMESGRLDEPPLEEDFMDQGLTVPVEFSVSARLPSGAPVRIESSWIDPTAVDDFRIRLRGSKADAVMDLRRSRDSVELIPSSGEPQILRGPAVESTYAQFIRLAEEHRSGGGAAGGAPDAAGFKGGLPVPSFAHALKVQETLDALLPGLLPL